MKVTRLETFVADVLHLIPVAPHHPVGPVMNAMTLHTALAIPSFSVFENVCVDVPWRKELVSETLFFADGHLLAPTAPGVAVRRRSHRRRHKGIIQT